MPTPTPNPTSSPVSSGNGGSFPNAANTGVPVGTALVKYTGSYKITTAGTVLSGYTFSQMLEIDADNVTVKNSYFPVSDNAITVSGSGTVIENCEFAGETPAGIGNPTTTSTSDAIYTGGNTTVQNNNFHGYTKDVYVTSSNVNVIGNYCSHIGSTGEHAEPIFLDGMSGGTMSNVKITGNTLVCNLVPGVPVAGSIFLSNNFGPESGITISGNLMVGGGYPVFVGFNNTGISNISVTDNVLGVGEYGYSYEGTLSSTDSWSGNTDFLTGQMVAVGGALSPNPNVIIASFTPSESFTMNSTTFGQNVATADAITLKGSTAAGHTVDIFDGATMLGSAMTSSAGVWTFETPTLASGSHVLTAKDTNAGTTSAPFTVLLP
jgi:hypothetical protein